MPHLLILEARFYESVSDLLITGALGFLSKQDVTFERVRVPGVLELPAALAMAASEYCFEGYITLGCVIKGASDHYDHVCCQAMRGLQDLAIQKTLALGNGILTVHSYEQALERADPERLDIGGLTARACLQMIDIKRKFLKYD